MSTQIIYRASIESPLGMATLITEDTINKAIEEYGRSEQEYFDYLEKELKFKYMYTQTFKTDNGSTIKFFNFKKV